MSNVNFNTFLLYNNYVLQDSTIKKVEFYIFTSPGTLYLAVEYIFLIYNKENFFHIPANLNVPIKIKRDLINQMNTE